MGTLTGPFFAATVSSSVPKLEQLTQNVGEKGATVAHTDDAAHHNSVSHILWSDHAAPPVVGVQAEY